MCPQPVSPGAQDSSSLCLWLHFLPLNLRDPDVEDLCQDEVSHKGPFWALCETKTLGGQVTFLGDVCLGAEAAVDVRAKFFCFVFMRGTAGVLLVLEKQVCI